MDTICYGLLLGYPVLAAAIGKLYRDASKAKDAHIKLAEEYARVVRELNNIARKKKRKKP